MKRFLSVLLALLMIISVFGFSAYAQEPNPDEEIEHNGVVSLDGKKIMVVGNSMVYYGNCVVYGNQGESDEGYLYQLIKQNGENATVIDHTYSGKKIDYIFEKYISKLSESERDIDYLILSEGNQHNYDLLGDVQKYLDFFPSDVEFRYLRQPMMFETDFPELIEGVEAIRNAGHFVVDWGQLVFDIYGNGLAVPGAVSEFKRSTFMKENLGFTNGEGTTHAAGKEGDRNHLNPLSGYIQAQMIYSSITNRSAILNDYQVCYDVGIHNYFNIDNFAQVHYTDPKNPTNFHEIFRSPQDMLGLQILIDEYLVKEGLHPLAVQQEVKPTCQSSGLTQGSYCTVCQKTVQKQEFIPQSSFGSHQLVYTKGEAPSCTENGKTVGASCSVCNKVIFEEKIIAKTGHVVKDYLERASSGSDGRRYKACLYCKEIFESIKIDKVSNIKLSTSQYTYNGKVKRPSVTVADSSGKSLVEGQDYVLSYPDDGANVGNHKIKVSFKGDYKGSKTLTFKIRPDAVENLTATAKWTSATLSWEAAGAATYYRIYKYNSATDSFSQIGDTTDTCYKVTGLTKGTKYKFRVRAIFTKNEIDYFSTVFKYVTTLTTPARAKISKVYSPKKRVANITVSAVNNAEGYEILYSGYESFEKSKILTIPKKEIISASVKKLSRGKRYYFKVRAYRTLSGQKVYGRYSRVKSVKIK